jgi:hypothetical protein
MDEIRGDAHRGRMYPNQFGRDHVSLLGGK